MLKRGFFLKSSESSGYFAYQKCLNSSFAVFFIPFGILWKDWFLNSQYKCIPWGNWVLCLRTTMEQQDEFKICVQQQEQYYLFKVIPYNSFLTWGFNMKNLNFISPHSLYNSKLEKLTTKTDLWTRKKTVQILESFREFLLSVTLSTLTVEK